MYQAAACPYRSPRLTYTAPAILGKWTFEVRYERGARGLQPGARLDEGGMEAGMPDRRRVPVGSAGTIGNAEPNACERVVVPTAAAATGLTAVEQERHRRETIV